MRNHASIRGASEDLKRLQDEENELKKLVQFASQQYQKAFHKLPQGHWANTMLKRIEATVMKPFRISCLALLQMKTSTWHLL
jgi:hypothetical protein